MSVIERSTTIKPFERAVFVTDDDRRARRLRHSAFAAGLLACLWLVGLGFGMFGFGSLPGVSLKPAQDGSSSEAPGSQQGGGERIDRQSRSVDPRGRLSARGGSGTAHASVSQRAAKAVQRSRSVTAPHITPPAAVPPAQQPVNPGQRQRGWAHNGLTAPPGQTRTAQPPPTSQGQRRGQTTTSTTTWVPPGQAKKTTSTG